MTNHLEPTNSLGEEITKRLNQLGMSRREFSRRFKLSRQTLHALEHSSGRGFAPTTFQAIDNGLKWPQGTAKGYYEGLANAKDLIGGSTVDELVTAYVGSIVEHVLAMNLDELEREVLMLEEETYGRPLPDMADALPVIKETVSRLSNAILNGPILGGKKVKDGRE